MHFLTLLLAIITLAFGAAVPIIHGDNGVLVEPARQDNTTDVKTQGATYIKYPVWGFYINKDKRGGASSNILFDTDLTQTYDRAQCKTLGPEMWHQVSRVELHQLYYRDGTSGRKHNKPRNCICQFFEAEACDRRDGYYEIDVTVADLHDIGWDNRIGSVHCKWKN